MLLSAADSIGTPHNILTDTNGRMIQISKGEAAPILRYKALNLASELTVWTPAAGKKFVLTDIILSSPALGNCILRDNTAGDRIMHIEMLANTTFNHAFITPVVSATANNVLTAEASAATQRITVCGYEI